MTKNEAYLYSKKFRRKTYTYIELEKVMMLEGFTEEDIKMVKAWLNNDRPYLNKIK